MKGYLERRLLHWFIRWHGEGERWQELLYRCQACRRLITWNHIVTQGLCSCGTNRLIPAYPTLLERIRLFVLPWTVK